MPLKPNTRSEVYYSYEIKANGTRIGTLQRFNPSQTRTADRLREIANNGGAIIEIVPGVTDFEITISKSKIYAENATDAFGYSVKTLQDIVDPVDVVEKSFHPDGTTSVLTWKDCWITRVSKSVVVGTTINTEEMTLFPTEVI